MSDVRNVVKILRRRSRLTAYFNPLRMMLLVQREGLNEAAESLGIDLEENPSISVHYLATVLGVEDEDLYRAIVRKRGLQLVYDESGDIDCLGEYVPVTTGVGVVDILKEAKIDEGGELLHPRLEWLPDDWFAPCARCGKKGANDEMIGSLTTMEEAAGWLVSRGVDPRQIYEVPRVEWRNGAYYCQECIEKYGAAVDLTPDTETPLLLARILDGQQEVVRREAAACLVEKLRAAGLLVVPEIVFFCTATRSVTIIIDSDDRAWRVESASEGERRIEWELKR